MRPDPNDRLGPLATLTHARLRAGQGDVRGARRILRELLSRDAGNREAAAALRALAPRTQRRAREEDPAVDEPRTPGDASSLSAVRRRLAVASDPTVVRLERWLRRIQRGSERHGSCSSVAPGAKV